MSTLTGLIGGGGGGGLASPTSSSYELTDGNFQTVFTSTEIYNFGTRGAGTFTIFSLTGSGYIWYLKHNGQTTNVFRGANPKIVVDGSDIIQQTSGDPAGPNTNALEMVGTRIADGAGTFLMPLLPFSSSFSFQIIVPSSLQSGDGCFVELGWCLKA